MWEVEAVFQKWKVTCCWCSNSPSPLNWGPFTFQVGKVVSTKMGQGSYGEFKAKLQKQSWARWVGLSNAYITSTLVEMNRCISFLKEVTTANKLLLDNVYCCCENTNVWRPGGLECAHHHFSLGGFATSRRRKTKRVKFMSGELFRGWQQQWDHQQGWRGTRGEVVSKVGLTGTAHNLTY